MIYFAWEVQLGFPLSRFIEIKLIHVGIKTVYDYQNQSQIVSLVNLTKTYFFNKIYRSLAITQKLDMQFLGIILYRVQIN